MYWITLVAVVVSSASAVLKAGFKQYDLLGVIIIAVATGLGDGSLRDMLLDQYLFWVKNQMFFIVSLASAFVIFLTARAFVISPKFFLIPDTAGLATFGIAGTLLSPMVFTSADLNIIHPAPATTCPSD
ncbi:MAG: TRIC cation channel family protein [Cocleimonas sp.]|nr:TRIC cation channel family protein [Cocleimonas sp.]